MIGFIGRADAPTPGHKGPAQVFRGRAAAWYADLRERAFQRARAISAAAISEVYRLPTHLTKLVPNGMRSLNWSVIRADIDKNRGSWKSLTIVLLYRASSSVARARLRAIRWLGIPLRILYKAIVEILMGVELPDKVRAGAGLAVFHGVGLVVNARVSLGDNVTLRQNTTIGEREANGGVPLIGNDVDIGANVVILGDIVIGDGTKIGAGAIVVDSCPANSRLINPKAISA